MKYNNEEFTQEDLLRATQLNINYLTTELSKILDVSLENATYILAYPADFVLGIAESKTDLELSIDENFKSSSSISYELGRIFGDSKKNKEK